MANTYISTGGGSGHRPGCACPFCTSLLARSESDASLTNPIARMPEVVAWEPARESYPYPQANDLDAVVSVIDIVNAGADTSEAISEALDLNPRQGGYYANAAGWLGLVEVDQTTEPNSWHLTSLGELVRNCGDSERATILASMVSRIDEVATIRAESEGALAKELTRDDLSETTANRRAASMASWARSISDIDELTNSIYDITDATRGRWEQAARTADEQRREARERTAANEPPPAKFCDSCFMQLPVNGECSNCD